MSSKIGNRLSSTLGACLMRFTQPVCRSLWKHIHSKVRPQQACGSHNCCCCNRQRGHDLAQQWQWPLFSLWRRPLGSLSRARRLNILLYEKAISECNFFSENGTRACMGRGWAAVGKSVTGGAAVRAKKYLNFYMQMSVANFGIKMNFYVVCVRVEAWRAQSNAGVF